MSSILDQWTEEHAKSVQRVQGVIIDAVLPLKAHVHPLIIAIALIRAARVLLRMADKGDQKKIIPVLNAYLEGRTRPPVDTPTSNLIHLPDRKH